MAHAAIGQIFDLPVILSTSADTGPNGVSIHKLRIIHCIILTPTASAQRVHRDVPQRSLHPSPR
jgi:hypothetical protein